MEIEMNQINKGLVILLSLGFSTTHAFMSCHGEPTADCSMYSSWSKNSKDKEKCKNHYQTDNSGFATGAQCYVGPGIVDGFNCLPTMSTICLVSSKAKTNTLKTNKKMIKHSARISS
jgi:hypothetical protein